MPLGSPILGTISVHTKRCPIDYCVASVCREGSCEVSNPTVSVVLEWECVAVSVGGLSPVSWVSWKRYILPQKPFAVVHRSAQTPYRNRTETVQKPLQTPIPKSQKPLVFTVQRVVRLKSLNCQNQGFLWLGNRSLQRFPYGVCADL